MMMENNILQHRLAVQSNIEKSFGGGFEKGRTGVYVDTAENRRLHRVGQKYGHKKEQEQIAGGGKGGEKNSFTFKEYQKLQQEVLSLGDKVDNAKLDVNQIESQIKQTNVDMEDELSSLKGSNRDLKAAEYGKRLDELEVELDKARLKFKSIKVKYDKALTNLNKVLDDNMKKFKPKH